MLWVLKRDVQKIHLKWIRQYSQYFICGKIFLYPCLADLSFLKLQIKNSSEAFQSMLSPHNLRLHLTYIDTLFAYIFDLSRNM